MDVMIIFQALAAGVIAGLTCFFPVSSLGCVVLFTHFFDFEENFFFYEMILAGLILASVSFYYKDILRLVISLLEMIRDLLYNLFITIKPKSKQKTSESRRILTNNYRNFTVILLISLIPILIVGFLGQRLVRFAFENELLICMGFMLTALLLLVSSFMNSGEKSPKKAKTTDALVMGVAECLSFIPGVSKNAMGISSGFLLGLSRKFVMKYTYLISMLCMIILIIPGRISFRYLGGTADPAIMIAAFLGSALTGSFMIRAAQKQISRAYNKLYAVLNLALAMTAACVFLITT